MDSLWFMIAIKTFSLKEEIEKSLLASNQEVRRVVFLVDANGSWGFGIVGIMSRICKPRDSTVPRRFDAVLVMWIRDISSFASLTRRHIFELINCSLFWIILVVVWDPDGYSCWIPQSLCRDVMIETSSYLIWNYLPDGAPRAASDANNSKSKIIRLKCSAYASRSPQASIYSLVCGVYVTNEKQHGFPLACG